MRKFSIVERWGVVSLLIVGLIYLYLNHFRDDIIKEQDALVAKNNEIVAAIDATVPPDNIESIEKRVNDLQKRVTELNKKYEEIKALRLVDKSGEEEMVLKLNEMAANNGLLVSQMIPHTAEMGELFVSVQSEQKSFGRLLYNVKLTGSFTSLYEFFSEIRSLPSLVNISHIKINRIKDSQDVNISLLFII